MYNQLVYTSFEITDNSIKMDKPLINILHNADKRNTQHEIYNMNKLSDIFYIIV